MLKDGKVLVWDVEQRRLLNTLQRHGDWVQAVYLLDNGPFAFSAGKDGRLMIWLILLGAIYREPGRREFDPPLTTRAFWISSGAGAVLSGLIYLVLLGIWEFR